MDIQIFNHAQFGNVRAINMDGEPLFCLKDVCQALVLDGKQVTRRLDKGVVSKHPLSTPGGMQMLSFVNEDGLYDVILDSRKPEAREFRKWVTSEVLPQIRKTGGYIPINEEDDEKTILVKALGIMKRTIEQKDALIEAQRPKVMFAEAVTSSDGSILIRDLAKLITQNGVSIGQTRLFAWLRDKGYLFKKETRPRQEWVKKGLFDTTITLIETHHGTIERCSTKVTGLGQEYFINGFLSGRFTASNDNF